MKINVKSATMDLGRLCLGDTFENNSQFYMVIDYSFGKPNPGVSAVTNLDTGDIVFLEDSTKIVKVDLEVRKVEREN